MVISRACNFFPIIGAAAVLLALPPLYYLLPVNPDSAVYDYVGLVVNQGGKLYQDAADQNWPGQMLIHVASVALFGSDIQSYRTFELLFILPLSCLIIAISLDKIYNRTAALISIPVYIAIYTTIGYWADGQREIVAAPLLVGAALMLYLRVIGSSRRVLICMGAFLFVAMLIRPTLLIMAPMLAIADVSAKRYTNRTLSTIFWDQALSTFILIFLTLCTAVLAHYLGILNHWFDISILFNLQVYGGGKTTVEILRALITNAISSWHWFILWSIIGALALRRKSPVALIFVGAIAPATLISVLAQGKGFIYHAVVIYPLFALLISIAMATGLRFAIEKNRATYIRLAAAIILCIPVVDFAKKAWSGLSLQRAVMLGKISAMEMYDQYPAGEHVTVGDVVRAADYINSLKTEDTKILVWGRPCHVYNLTGLTSPLFAASFALLDEPTQSFELFDKWHQHIEDVFGISPPEFLLLVKNPVKNEYEHFHEDSQPRLSDVIKSALPRYQLERTFSNLHVFKLAN